MFRADRAKAEEERNQTHDPEAKMAPWGHCFLSRNVLCIIQVRPPRYTTYKHFLFSVYNNVHNGMICIMRSGELPPDLCIFLCKVL